MGAHIFSFTSSATFLLTGAQAPGWSHCLGSLSQWPLKESLLG